MFDIETREGGVLIDRGIDRMWVLVKRRTDDGYLGVLDGDPGYAENLDLRPGTNVVFTGADEGLKYADHDSGSVG